MDHLAMLLAFFSLSAMILFNDACRTEVLGPYFVETSKEHEKILITKLPVALHLDCFTSTWNYTILTWTPQNISMTVHQYGGNVTVISPCMDTPQAQDIYFTCAAYENSGLLARSIQMSVMLGTDLERGSLKYVGLIIGFSVCGCLLLMSIAIVHAYHWWNHGLSMPWSRDRGLRPEKGGRPSEKTDGRQGAGGNFILQTFNQRRQQKSQPSGTNTAYHSSGTHGSKIATSYDL